MNFGEIEREEIGETVLRGSFPLVGYACHSRRSPRARRATTTSGVKVAQQPEGLMLAPGGGA
jgi:hypothetical protein